MEGEEAPASLEATRVEPEPVRADPNGETGMLDNGEDTMPKQPADTQRSKLMTTRSVGYVGQSPSSLASLARGKCYFVDPYTPFTPRPDTLSTRDQMVGPPLATYRSNHWITQTSPAYIPRRLQNHRIPRTPPEVKRGFPAKNFSRPQTDTGEPKYLVDGNGHLLPRFKKPGRTAFPQTDEVGRVSWTFSRMGYV
mmetsp:Transcript_45165/g.70802  ORF Transcript_45165/g.70802 Transcript_45165/m.70802 type:complete len:195 (+) Transcript_45165:24-608(+)